MGIMNEKMCKGCSEVNETRFKYCQKEIISECQSCHNDLIYKCSSKTPITCSKICASQLIMKNRQAKNKLRSCECCGDDFQPKAFNSKYCLKEKTFECLYKDCSKSFKVICNNDYTSYCSKSCCKKDMRKNNYNIAIKNCVLCSEEYKPTSSRQKVCTNDHYNKCEFCDEDFLVTSMFNAIGRNKYCDNICSTFAQMNSTINRSLVSEYKNINKWAHAFFKINNRKPNAVNVKEYFGFNKSINLKDIPNIDMVLFDQFKNYSTLENIVEEYLKNNYSKYKYIHNYRYKFDDGKSLEIDFYIPELKLGFEVQDFGTHDKISDNIMGKWGMLKKGPAYHKNKRDKYSEIDVKVIEIWQDELFDESYKNIINKYMKK